MQSSFSPSLSCNLDQGVELVQFIAALNSLNPKEIRDIGTLKKRVMEEFAKPDFAMRAEQTRDLLGRMIFHQFPNIPIAASCEMLSNSRDAQARAKREGKPIVMKVHKNTLDLFDHGDGMDAPGLATFLSIGRSSNPEAIYDLDKGMANVTGRYGHGAVSIYYYLAYDWLHKTAMLPAFKADQESLSLTIQHQEQDRLFESTFSVLFEDGQLSVETKPLEKGQQDKKIRIVTGKGQEAYKMVFKEEDRSIFVKIKPLQETCVGTAIQVSSPLVEEKQFNIAEQTEKAFRFVTSTPIEINGRDINPPSRYHKLSFEGVTLLFSPEKQARGSVAVCENGRVVQEYDNEEGAEIPFEMALSFDKLPLTSDRAIVHFEDPKTLAIMRKMVQTLLEDPSLTHQEKAVLLNGLYPILKADRFHMLKEVKTWVSKWGASGLRLLPDTKGMRSLKIENAVHLHPEFLDEMNLTPFYMKGARALYALPFQREDKVAEMCTTGPSTHLFLNQDYFKTDNPLATYFHLHLLQHWCANRTAKQQDKGLFLDREWLQSTFLPQKPAAVENGPSVSLADFEQEEGANEKVNPAYFHQLLQEKCKTNNDDLLTWLHFFMRCKCQRYAEKKFYHYLLHVLTSQPTNKGHHFNAGMIAWGVNAFRDLSSFDCWYQAVYKLTGLPHPIDYSNRSTFLTSDFIRQACQQGTKITEKWLEEQYSCRMALLKKAQAPEHRAHVLFNDHSRESLDLLEALVDKISHPALKAIPLVGVGNQRLSDLNALLAMPSETLTEFLCVLPRGTEASFCWTAEDYRFFEKSILPLRCDLKTKAKWMEVYLVGRQILASSLPLQSSLAYKFEWNTKAFSHLLMEEATEESTIEYASAILAAMKRAKDNLNRFAQSCENVLPHTPQPYMLCGKVPDQACAPLPGLQTAQQSIEAIGKFLSYFFPQPKANGMREWIFKSWETAQLIPDAARPFIYAALMGSENFLRFTDYRFNSTCKGKKVLVHEDEEVTSTLGNSEVVKAAMEEAIRHARTIPNFWIVELIKNSLEAGADEITFDVHTTSDGSIVVVAEDDGRGMSKEDKKKCKMPGKTTKRRDLDDPNFGIGWKSALAEFRQVRFTTSTGGNQAEVLLFTNTKDGVTVQEETLEGDFNPGTKIEMIKDPVPYPLVDFIQMKSRCLLRARQMEGINILFQGDLVNRDESVEPKVSICEPLFVKGAQVGQATVQIGPWDEGLYAKNIKMAPLVPEKYLKQLPELLKQALQHDGARLRIFLPPHGQIFNRSLLTDEESTLPQIQKLVLKAACDYLAACWLEGKHLNLLSNEYWYMYETSEKVPSKSVEALYKDRNAPFKQQLLSYIETHFKTKPAQFPYTCLADKKDLSQLLKHIQVHDRANRKGETVKERLDNPRAFLKFARRCPLQPHGLSLDALCLKLKTSLTEKGILTETSYNMPLIASKELAELTGLLDSCLLNLSKELGNSYNPLLRMFRQQTLLKLTNIKKEQARKDQNPKDIPPELSVSLVRFLTTAAKTYFGKQIEIRFEEDPTGHAAHTQKGTNILWINRNSQIVQRFLSAFSAVSKRGPAGLETELVPLAADWLELLAHEATHMDDASDCQNLHDAQFYSQTARLIERMFIKPGSGKPNGYELFLETMFAFIG